MDAGKRSVTGMSPRPCCIGGAGRRVANKRNGCGDGGARVREQTEKGSVLSQSDKSCEEGAGEGR